MWRKVAAVSVIPQATLTMARKSSSGEEVGAWGPDFQAAAEASSPGVPVLPADPTFQSMPRTRPHRDIQCGNAQSCRSVTSVFGNREARSIGENMTFRRKEGSGPTPMASAGMCWRWRTPAASGRGTGSVTSPVHEELLCLPNTLSERHALRPGMGDNHGTDCFSLFYG